VEPAEVESRIREHAGVTDVVVQALELGPDAGRALVAYVTGAVDPAALRGDLKTELPDYMVPAHVVVLDAFPLNPPGRPSRTRRSGGWRASGRRSWARRGSDPPTTSSTSAATA
jgi:acyl-CoA synthetase (AMP-forming)/AMP-acid ligase II